MPPSVRTANNSLSQFGAKSSFQPIIRTASMKGYKQFGLDSIQENECVKTATDRRPPRGLRLVRSESVPISKFASLFLTEDIETIEKRKTWSSKKLSSERIDPERCIASEKPTLLLSESYSFSTDYSYGDEDIATMNEPLPTEDLLLGEDSSVSDSSSDDDEDDVNLSDYDSSPDSPTPESDFEREQASPITDSCKVRSSSPSFRSRISKGFRGVFSLNSPSKSGCRTGFRARRTRPRSTRVVL